MCCIGISKDGAGAMTGWLSSCTTWVKDIASECEFAHCVTQGETWASQKMLPEKFLGDVIKIMNYTHLLEAG